jgi:hypothetical protein
MSTKFVLSWRDWPIVFIPPKFEFISGMIGHLNLCGKFTKFRVYPAVMFLTHFECVWPGCHTVMRKLEGKLERQILNLLLSKFAR